MTQQEIEKLAEEECPSAENPKSFAFQNYQVVEMERQAFIAGAKSQSMSDWVSVDVSPKVGLSDMVKVIGWNGSEALLVDYYQHKDEELGRFRVNCLKCFNDVTESITHYMELPTPPQTSK